jgi:hypothetical protein
VPDMQNKRSRSVRSLGAGVRIFGNLAFAEFRASGTALALARCRCCVHSRGTDAAASTGRFGAGACVPVYGYSETSRSRFARMALQGHIASLPRDRPFPESQRLEPQRVLTRPQQ